MAIYDANYTMGGSTVQDVKKYTDGDAMSDRIMEWLDTPEGTMAHYPAWGHNLGKFKFEPLAKGNGIETVIEMAITRKLPLDISDLQLIAIEVTITDIDAFRLVIVHQFGASTIQVKL